MATQRGVAADNRVHDSDFDDCEALLEGRMGDGWQLFFQTPEVQVSAAPRGSVAPRTRAATAS